MSYLTSLAYACSLDAAIDPQRFQLHLVRIQQLLCSRNLTYATGAINSFGIDVNYPYLRLARLSEGSIWRREEGRRVKSNIFTLNALKVINL